MGGTPTRSGDRRAERRAATVDRIVAAAWRLSAGRGLGGWTLRDLGSEVGMRAPSLYEYVAGKDALYDLLYADGYRAFLRRVEAMARSGDPLEDLRAAAHLFVEFCVEDPARCQLLFLRPVPGFEPSRESYALAQDVLTQLGAALDAAGHGDPHEVDLWTAVPGFEPSPESYALAQDVLGRLATALEAAGHGDPHEVDLWTAVLTGLATQQASNDPGGDRWTRLVDTAVDRFLAAG